MAGKDSLRPVSIITRKRPQNGLLRTPARKGLWPGRKLVKCSTPITTLATPALGEPAADIVELATTMLLHRKSTRIRKKMNGLDALQTLNFLDGFWGVSYLSPNVDWSLLWAVPTSGRPSNKSIARKKLRL